MYVGFTKEHAWASSWSAGGYVWQSKGEEHTVSNPPHQVYFIITRKLQAIPHVSAWRGKSQPNAWSLLVQLWRQEEADLEVPRDVMNTVAGTARVCVCFSALQLMLSLMFCCTVFRHNPATRWSRPESSGDASTAVKPAIAINNGRFWEHESKDLCTLHQAGLPVSFRQPHHRGQDYHVHHTELPGL